MSARESRWSLALGLAVGTLIAAAFQWRDPLPLDLFAVELAVNYLSVGGLWVVTCAMWVRYESSDPPRRGPDWYRDRLSALERRRAKP